jgi:hypothetical protein
MNNGGIKMNNLDRFWHDWNCGVCQQHADWIQNNLGMGLERVSVIAMLQEYWANHIRDKHDD